MAKEQTWRKQNRGGEEEGGKPHWKSAGKIVNRVGRRECKPVVTIPHHRRNDAVPLLLFSSSVASHLSANLAGNPYSYPPLPPPTIGIASEAHSLTLTYLS